MNERDIRGLPPIRSHSRPSTRSQHGPRFPRGLLRLAVLGVLQEKPLNGYKIMQAIADRTEQVWRPSPGSLYPALRDLHAEALVETEESDSSSRQIVLTDAGRRYAAAHSCELEAMWARAANDAAEVGPMLEAADQLLSALEMVIRTGTHAQRRRTAELLRSSASGVYRILGD